MFKASAFLEGFVGRCSALGIDPKLLVKFAAAKPDNDERSSHVGFGANYLAGQATDMSTPQLPMSQEGSVGDMIKALNNVGFKGKPLGPRLPFSS